MQVRSFICSNAKGVQMFRGSRVQGCMLIGGLHGGCVFKIEASASPGLIRNLEPNWQLFGKMSIVNEDFGFLMPSLSLTPER
jgi:hypothetical protein